MPLRHQASFAIPVHFPLRLFVPEWTKEGNQNG